MTTIKERILQIAEDQGIAKEKFFEYLGTTYGNYKGKAKDRQVGSDVLVSIITNFGINAHWLLTGEGEMYQNNNVVHDPDEGYGNNKDREKELLESNLEKAEKLIKHLEKENARLRENIPKSSQEKQPRAGRAS